MFEIKEICAAKSVLEITDDEQWGWWTQRQELTNVHKKTECIPLKFTDKPAFFRERFNRENIKLFPAYEIYKPILDEYLELLSDHYEWIDYIAILTKLLPRSKIRRHRDQGKWLEAVHRIHMPVVTNPDVLFSVGETRINMKRGVFYEINNVLPHDAVNRSDEDRVHLIIDLLPPG